MTLRRNHTSEPYTRSTLNPASLSFSCRPRRLLQFLFCVFGVPDETEQQSEDVTLIAQEGLGGQLEGLGLRV